MHSTRTCIVTKWLPRKTNSLATVLKTVMFLCMFCLAFFTVIIGTIGRKEVQAPPCLQRDQKVDKIDQNTHCRIIIPLPPPR